MSSQDKQVAAKNPVRGSPWRKVVLSVGATLCLSLSAVAGYSYWKYATVTDHYINAALAGGPAVRVTDDQLPPSMVDAILSAEDPDFFTRSVSKDYAHQLLNREDQTRMGITMNLARISCAGTRTLTLSHLVLEIAVAIRLEGRFSKQQIFELYVNRVYLGRSREDSDLFGFADASRAYFNREVRDLTLPEIALLAGLIRSPNRDSPFVHPDRALARRDYVLQRMEFTGKISAQQYEEIRFSALRVTPEQSTAKEH